MPENGANHKMNNVEMRGQILDNINTSKFIGFDRNVQSKRCLFFLIETWKAPI